MHRSLRPLPSLISLAVFGLCLAAGAQAASRPDLHRADLGQLNHQYRLASQGLGAAATASERHAELLGLEPDSKLEVIRHREDRRGNQYYRYQQTFRGIPVFGEQIVVSEGRGLVRKLFGRKLSGLAAELPRNAPSIGKARALQAGRKAALGARAASMTVQREAAPQVIFVGDDKRVRLAYLVSFFADQPGGGAPTRPFVMVDAATGAVLRHWDGLAHAGVGTGPGGNTKTGVYEYGLDYGYNDVSASNGVCTFSNAQVRTVHLGGGSVGDTPFSYACPRNANDAVNGAFSPLNDAHFFGKVAFDMYGAYLGVAPLAGPLTMRVHYGSNYQNAFWDGVSMTFGDGGSLYYPMVSLDLATHEVSHGFTQANSNLTYQGMSGAINEAFSDMAGEAAEYFLRGSNDFKVGAQVVKGNGVLRSMDAPSQDGQSIEHASAYRDGLNVHYASGVYNKAFALLARRAGWNTRKAFQVFARANQLYWTPSTSFDQGACGVLSASADLGFVQTDVSAAFAAVGVNCYDSVTGDINGGTLSTGIMVSADASSDAAVLYRIDVPAGAERLLVETASGIGDADLYLRYGSAPTLGAYDCAPQSPGNFESCEIVAPKAGVYFVRVVAFSTFAGVNVKASVVGNQARNYASTLPVAIAGGKLATSAITVAGRVGKAGTASKVAVDISYPQRSGLSLALVAPDGSSYPLKVAVSKPDGVADLVATYTVDLSSEALDGRWTLRVQDRFRKNTGTLNGWSLTF